MADDRLFIDAGHSSNLPIPFILLAHAIYFIGPCHLSHWPMPFSNYTTHSSLFSLTRGTQTHDHNGQCRYRKCIQYRINCIIWELLNQHVASQ